MSDPYNWTCPHCGVPQTLTAPKISRDVSYYGIEKSADGNLALASAAFGCANPECGKVTVVASLHNWAKDQLANRHLTSTLEEFKLVPRGRITPQPEYIPDAVRKDYREAALVREYSANAAAALARRCLQGMLVDFAGMKKDLLAKQISALRGLVEQNRAPQGVSTQSVNAIDHVREIGNVGAHMETPTGLIVDVEPEEADALIELIETLFKDWYVERHNREQRYARIERIAAEKKEQIANSRAAARTGSDLVAERDPDPPAK